MMNKLIITGLLLVSLFFHYGCASNFSATTSLPEEISYPTGFLETELELALQQYNAAPERVRPELWPDIRALIMDLERAREI